MNKKLTRKALSTSVTDAFGDPLEPTESGWARPYATDQFSPFWYASGDDDDEDEEDDDEGKGDEDEEEDDDDDDDEDKGKTPEELAAEVKRLRAAYLKKLKNSKNRGTRIKDLEGTKTKLETDYATLQEQFAELQKTAGKEVDTEAAQRRINELVDKARDEGKEAFKPVVIRMAAKAELMAQGARPTLVDKLVRMIDIAEVDIDDDDGSIDVTDQVLAIKKEFAEYFGPRKATTTRRRKSGEEGGDDKGSGGSTTTRTKGGSSSRKAGAAGGGDEGAGETKKTTAQILADRLRGVRD